ncbi:MAG: filamentous hemagglutinin N-terminal domain-containing protein [Acetobacteraceae bacterium]
MAKHKDKIRLLGVVRRNRPALMMSTALQATVLLVLSVPAQAQPFPNARPTGGTVVAGTAAISRTATNTQIDQSTQRAAIDWKTFNVGSQQSVTFNQPSASAMTLNRVTGPDPSHIAGRITANGQIVLVNQSGVTFHKGAQVNAAGVMVSAANISNANFMAGVMKFDQPGNPNAKIDNRGNITVKEAGLAALVAPQVANSGTITATLGHVVLAGARTATLDLYGDGLLSLNVNDQVVQAPVGKDGKSATALVTNSGVIIADGGTVQLTARAADGIVQNLVQAGGTIRAGSVGDKAGVVALNGVGGSIIVEGQLGAPGDAPGTRGGSVEVVTNGNVIVTPTAKIDASGKAGGGTVAVGTTLARGRDVKAVPAQTAAGTVIRQGATISADATQKGDGGRVTVLSQKATSMAGTITAKGGAQGGNGGFAEVSGAGVFSLTGVIDTSAPLGNPGTILLDPDTLTIINNEVGGGDQDTALIDAGGTIVFADPNTAKNTVSNSLINSLNGTILLEANLTITIEAGAPITLQKDAGLILQTATGNITLGAGSPITASGNGFVILDAGLTAGSGGRIVLGSDITADAATGIIRLQADGGIDLATSKLSAAAIDLSNITAGGITQAAGGALIASVLTSTGGVAGDTTLMSTANAVSTLDVFNVTGGSFALTDNSALTVSGTVAASGNVYLQSADAAGLTIAGTVTAGAAGIAGLQANAIAIGAAGTVTAGTVELAPNSALVVNLAGTGGLELPQATLSRIGANLLRIGAVTVPTLGEAATAGAIAIGGAVDLAGIATTLDLHARGAVLEQAGGTLANVGTLTGASGSFDVTDAGAANTVATVGSYAVSGDFKLTAGGGITAAGPLTGSGIDLKSTGSPIVVGGTVQGTTFIALDGGTVTFGTGANVGAPIVVVAGETGIALQGSAVVGQTGAAVDFNTIGGDVTEAATASIVATTLQSTIGIAGSATLLGTNSVLNIGSLAVTGDFALANTTPLTVGSTLSAGGNTFLRTSDPAGITVGAAGLVAAGAASRASFQAPALAIAAGGQVTGGTFEFAPDTAAALTLGTGGSFASLAGISATSVVIGGVTVPVSGFAVTASSIDTVGTFNGNNLSLALHSTGTIGEAAAAPIINVATLTGSASAATLNAANAIASLGSFATTGDFLLADAGLAGTLTVSGPLTGANVTLSGAPAIDVTGSIGATGTASLSGVALLLSDGAVVTGPTVALSAGAGGVTMTGTAAIGQAGGTVDLTSAGGVTEAATGVITAATLLSSGGVSGDVTLPGTANAIDAIGNFQVLGDLALVDGKALQVTGSVAVSGALNQLSIEASGVTIAATGLLSADAASGLVSLHTDNFANSGSVATAVLELAPQTVGRAMTLGAPGGLSLLSASGITTGRIVVGAVTPPGGARTTTAGAIAIGGTFDTTGIPLLVLDATGAVTQSAPLIGGSQVTGTAASFTLMNAANAFSALGVTATGGNIQVADTTALTLGANSATGDIFVRTPAATLGGTVSASGTLGLQTDAFSFVSGSLGGSTFEVAPLTAGTLETLGAAGGLSLLDASFITGNLRIGAVTIPGLGLTTTAGTIVVGGNFGTPTLVLELDSLGSISQAVGGALTAGTLSGSAGLDLNLAIGPNAIGTLGAFSSTGAFSLDDGGIAGNLAVNGPIGGTTITIRNAPTITVGGSIGANAAVTLASGAGGVVVDTGGIVTGPTVTIDGSTGGIALTGTGRVGSAGGIVDLTTTGVGVSEAAGAIVTAGTLRSTGGVTGPFDLSLGANAIANLGSIAVSGGAFTLNDAGRTGTLGVAGPVTATNVTLVSGTGALTVGGSIGATGTVSLDGSNPTAGIVLGSGALVTGATIDLNGGTIGIALTGTASLGNAGAILDLTTTGGGVTEAGGAVMTGTLQSTAGVVGNVDLLGTANAVDTLGNFAVTGGRFALNDGVALTVAGTVTSPGQVYLQTTDAGGVAIAAAGSIGAGTLASVQADQFLNAGTVTGTIFEWAPATTLATQTLLALSGVPDSIRIGAVTLPGSTTPTITAGSIVVGGAFGSATTSLELDSLGGIDEAPGGAITAANLVGQAGTTVALTNVNTIQSLGNFPVTAGSFTLDNTGAAGIFSVNGSVSAAGIIISDAATLSVTGTLNAGSDTLRLTAGDGGIQVNAGALLSAGTVDLNSIGGIGQTTGVIAAGTLLSSGGVTGSVALDGPNNVATLGAFTVTGGNFLLLDSASAAGLAVTGPVVADNVTLGGLTGPLSIAGSIGATGTVALDGSGAAAGIALTDGAIVTGSTVALNGGTVGIVLTGNAVLGRASGVVDLTTTGGGVAETESASIIAATLRSTGGITGDVALNGTANAVATIGSLAVTGGTFSLNDAGPINVIGPLTGSDVTIIDNGVLTVSGSLIASGTAALVANSIDLPGRLDGGTVALFSLAGGITQTGSLNAGTLIGNAAGAVSLTGTNQVSIVGDFSAAGFTLTDGIDLTVAGVLSGGSGVTLTDQGTLTVAGTVSAAAIALTAGDIAIPGLVTDGGAGTTSLTATIGTISETGTLVAGTLSGSSIGATTFDGATPTTNQIAGLGDFSAAGFTLNNGIDLTIGGTLAGGPVVTVVDAGALAVTGAVTADAIALVGTSIQISGLVSDGGAGTTALVATAGGISETGTLVVGTLSGGATGSASLLGATATANQIAAIGDFSASGVTVNDGISLSVVGTLNGGPSVTVLDSGTLTVASGGTVTATSIGLTADDLVLSGLVSDGGAGTTSLVATTGTISESGTLVVGTLSGSSVGATSLLGATATANQIATLGDFTSSGFTLRNGIDLSVAGTLDGGPSVTVLDSGTLTVASGGTVTATSIGLTAADLAIAGLVSDGGAGTTSLVATTGTISESGTLVVGTLSGSSVGATSLLGATATTNQIATLGNFTSSGFTLRNGIDLSVAGTLDGGPSVTVTDSGTLTVASGGTVTAGGTLTAGAISLTAANLVLSGRVSDGGTGTTSLVATTGTISESGTLVAGTLSGSSVGATSLLGATATTNRVATLGNFTASGFTLRDGISLSVAGTLNGGPSVTVLDSGTLTVASGGTVTATSIALTAADLAIAGLVSDGGAGTTGLVATTGTISESGTLVAGTLSGSSVGATGLLGATATTNRVATLGDFTASGFTLRDGISLSVVGTLNGGPSVTVTDSATLTVASGGTVTATSIALTAANLAIAGLVSDGGAGTTNLVATTGTISESGTLVVGTLSGSSAGATSLPGATATANQIATLGDFTSVGFSLRDGISLGVAGTLSGGPSVTVLDNGTLTIASSGTVSATAISLTANDIAIAGLSTDGGSGTTSLVATTGTISEPGFLISGTLSGSAATRADLSGVSPSVNQVGTLGSFTAVDFVLNDGIALNVVGPVIASSSVAIEDAGALLVSGTIAPPSGTTAIAVSLIGETIDIPGLVSDGGAGTTSLVANGGTIGETGTLIAGTLSGEATGGDSTQAVTLVGAGPTANQIATLGSFVASDFTLVNGIPLVVQGPLRAASSVTITDAASLSVTGTIVPVFSSPIPIALTATSIQISGLVSDGGAGTTALVATAGGISETGTLVVGTLSGGATGSASLLGATATANQIAAIGDFSASGVTVNDGISLSVVGTLNGGPSVTVLDSGTLTVASGGTVTATSIGLTADDLVLSGLVSDGGAGTTSLVATTGTISESGTLVVGTLSGSSVGATSLLGATATANQIATLGDFTSSGFTLRNGIDLSVAGTLDGGPSVTVLDSGTLTVASGGTVTATSIGLTAADLAIAGLVSDGGAGTTSLVATTGTISESGTLVVGTLSGSSVGATSLLGATATTNQIATLGNFTSSGFTLRNGIDLSVAGTLDGGPSVTVTDSGTLTVASGGTVTAGGTLTAGAISLTAANLVLSGRVSDGGTGTTSLVATTGTISESGTLVAGTLSGSSVGATSLLGATATTNRVATLGNFTASGFTLRDGISLSVAGTLNGGPSVTVLDSGTLTVASGGTVTATSIALTAADLAIAGLVSDGGAGTTGLVATTGTISESGTLVAGTLSGSSVGATGLLGATATTNRVATLGDFTASGFTLRDGISLSVVGTLNGGPSVTVTDSATLTVASGGTVTATSIALTAANLAIAGLVSDGGAGTTNLVATTGTISESGTLVVGTLSGSSAGATSLPGATATANQIATLGDFTSVGFSLRDGISLGVAGTLSGGPSVTVLDNGTLTIASSGTVSATAISLTANDIAIAGLSTDGGSGTTSLVATTGTISEPGFLISGTLSGSAATRADLSGVSPSVNQVGTLGSFTAVDFVLNDGIALNVVGPVIASSSVAIEDAGALLVSGTIAPPSGTTAIAVSLIGETIDIPGLVSDGGAGTTSLVANGGTIGETGTLIAGTLSGEATGGDSTQAVTLVGAGPTANQIATLGSFVASDFTLVNGIPLVVQGPLRAASSVTITDAASLSVTGTIVPVFSSPIPIALTATSIQISGLVSDGGAGTTALVATAGGISETGTLVVGTLSGGATSGPVLQSATFVGANQIGTLAAFSASDFLLTDDIGLTVAGPLTAGTSATIASDGALLVSGTIAPPVTVSSIAVELSGTSINIPGLVSDGGAGTTALFANAGTISETGRLLTGTLTGSASNGDALQPASLFGAALGINQIATLGDFAASSFTLFNGIALNVAGTLTASAGATIVDTASLLVSGAIVPESGVAGIAVGLTAAAITIPGLVSDGGGGFTSLVATSGTIGETGTLVSGALSGSATGAVDLAGAFPTANRITTIGNFTAPSFNLANGVDLAVTGTLNGGLGVTLVNAGALLVGGGGTVVADLASLTAASMSIAGLVTDGGAAGGSVGLFANSGTISETGTVAARTLFGSAAASVSLLGATPTANRIDTISEFTSSGFTLVNGVDLTVSGPLNGGPGVTLFDNGTLLIGVGGRVTGTAIGLTANSLNIAGVVSDGGAGTTSLVATSGAIGETGTIVSGTLSGSAAGAANLLGASLTANQIGRVSGFTASGLALNDGADLTITGNVIGGPSVTLLGARTVTVATEGVVAGNVIAANTAGDLVVDGQMSGAGISVTSDANIVVNGLLSGNVISANSGGGMSVNGQINGSAVDAVSGGGMSVNGQISGSTINATSGSDIAVNGLISGSTISANATGGFEVNGAVIGTAVTATTNATIGINGTLEGSNQVILRSTAGDITGTGTLVTDLMTGSAGGEVELTGLGNRVAQVGSFSAAGFTLFDSAALAVTGPVTGASVINLTANAAGAAVTIDGALQAPTIIIDGGVNPIAFTGHATLTTGGTARPPVVTSFPGEPGTPLVNGAFLTTSAGFTQTGSSTITGIGGGPSVLRINASGGANITFDPNAGLQGRDSTWLILAIDTGRASGQVNVQYLDVIRAGATGSTELTGTVAGLAGSAAAGAAGIEPSPNSNFRFNACPIRSVNCVLLPTQGIPLANPLNDIYFGSLFNPDDEDDLLLPIVSDQDY